MQPKRVISVTHCACCTLLERQHDTLLDSSRGAEVDHWKRRLLKSLPENVVYLENSGVRFHGVHIWGSPVTRCRQEEMGKRYYSNAFETPRKERR